MPIKEMASNVDTPVLPSGYKFLKKLGQGGYGSVYSCREVSSGKEIAVKQLSNDAKTGIPYLMEANIMSSFNHPHLNRANRIIVDGRGTWIFQEKAINDLGHLVRREKKIPTGHQLKQWAFQALDGLTCLHQHGIIHGDVKADNILLYENGTIKLSDFNLSQKIWKSGTRFKYRSCTSTHRPLEVCLDKDWDMSIDIWALGCTFFELAYGESLFPYQGWDISSKDRHNNRSLITNRTILCLDSFAKGGPGGAQDVGYWYRRTSDKYLPFRLPEAFWRSENSAINQLILSMLRFKPSERPTSISLLTHAYFSGLTPSYYQGIHTVEEEISRERERKSRDFLKQYTSNTTLIEATISLTKKINGLRFYHSSYSDIKLQLIGAHWIVTKLVLRRSPPLPYPADLVLLVERRICEYLNYCLFI